MERGVILLFKRPVELLQWRRPPPFFNGAASQLQADASQRKSSARPRHNSLIIITTCHLPGLFCAGQLRLRARWEEKQNKTNVAPCGYYREMNKSVRFEHFGQSRKTRQQSVHFLTFCSAEKNHLLMRTDWAECPLYIRMCCLYVIFFILLLLWFEYHISNITSSSVFFENK